MGKIKQILLQSKAGVSNRQIARNLNINREKYRMVLVRFTPLVLCTDVVNYLSLSFVPSFNKYEMFQILHAHTLQEKWLF